MLDKPKLSIIVPTLNEAAYIEELLTRLHAWQAAGVEGNFQRGVEIVVVDGGSRDDTVALARPLASKVIIREPGRSRQMNAGAREAGGGHLLFLHADTRLPAHAPFSIESALSGQRVWGRFDVRLEGRHPMLPLIAFAMNLRSRLTGIATGDQGLFMTREAFDNVGGFPDQQLMEDIEISCRLKRLSPPACLRAKVTSSGRRWEHNGAWRTIRLMWRLRYRYWRGVSADILAREYRDVR